MPPVGVDQRPVFQMHVGIADQRVEGQSPDKFGNVGFATLGANDPANAARAGVLVFFLGIDTEYLREILHVNGTTR